MEGPEIPHCACFQGFCVSGHNLAMPCHAKNKCKMWLSMATHRDIYATSWSRTENILSSRQILHACKEEGQQFLRQRGKERAEEIFTQQCKENIAQGNIEQDILNDQEEIFVPNERARHRVPKTFSLANPTQKKQNQPNVQKTTNNKTIQQNQKKNTNQERKKKSVPKPKQQNSEKKKIVILNKCQEFLMLKKNKN